MARREPVRCLCGSVALPFHSKYTRQWWVCCSKAHCRVGPAAKSRIAAIGAWDYLIARAKEAKEAKG